MATDSTNQINRNANVATDKAEVEVYLDREHLLKIQQEYVDLRQKLLQWAGQMKLSMKKFTEYTSGSASYAFENKYKDYDIVYFSQMYNRLASAICINATAIMEAKKLIVQCENFYEIVVGGQVIPPSSCVETETDILYLDSANYTNGFLNATTEEAVTEFRNISNDFSRLEEILGKLKEKQINYYVEALNICTDLNKKDRLTTLYEAFDTYVNGVKTFNTDIAQQYSYITRKELIGDHSRSYDYSSKDKDVDQAQLDRILRSELDKMHISDDVIDKALKNGFSLYEVAACIEAVTLEDKVRQKDGKEVEFMKCILIGDSKKAYEYIDDVVDTKVNIHGGVYYIPATACSFYAAKFLNNSLHTGFNNNRERFADLKSSKHFMSEMNIILGDKNSQKILELYKNGTYMVALSSNHEYGYMKANYEGEIVKRYGEEHRKALLIYDTFEFLDKKIDADDKFFSKEDYIVADFEYGDDIILDVSNKQNGKSFTMTVGFEDDFDSVNDKLSTNNTTTTVDTAVKAQEKAVERMFRDTVYLGAVVIDPSWSVVARGITNIDLSEGTATTNANNFISSGGKFALKQYYKTLDDGLDKNSSSYYKDKLNHSNRHVSEATRYDAATGVVFDAYNVIAATDAVDAAKREEENTYFSRMVGSVGTCTYEIDGEDKTYAIVHTGMQAHRYDDKLNKLATDGYGLKDICGISDYDAGQLEKKWKGKTDYDKKMSMLYGGYKFDSSSSAKEFYDDMEKFNEDYKALMPDGTDEMTVDKNQKTQHDIWYSWGN